MSRLHSRRPVQFAAALTLLPFLDIVFSTIGVFVIVFVLREVVRAPQEGGRRPAIDSLIVCTSDRDLTLYLTPHAPPRAFTAVQLPQVFEAFTADGGGIRNLVFALTRDCIGMRQQFEEALANFTALHRRQRERAAAAVRLAFRPLAEHPAAAAQLLAAWRGESHE
jgi:hypothetical protein